MKTEAALERVYNDQNVENGDDKESGKV